MILIEAFIPKVVSSIFKLLMLPRWTVTIVFLPILEKERAQRYKKFLLDGVDSSAGMFLPHMVLK